MPFLPKARQVVWTRHAKNKMVFYRLSEQRVLRVLHTPRRTEEGVAPKTIAMMQPSTVRTAAGRPDVGKENGGPARKEIWSQEIWVMVQDLGRQRKIVSVWRYPGMTKPRSESSLDTLRREYREFLREGK